MPKEKKEEPILGYRYAHIPKLKEHALKTSIKEGAAGNTAMHLGDAYMIPFALALKAKPFHIGFLSSFSGFLYQMAQFFGTLLMRKHPRKKIITKAVSLQALIWLFIAILGILFWKGIFQEHLIWALIVSYSLIMFFGGIAYPSWFSWMGDIVPENARGQYFSKRNRIASSVGLIVTLAAAFFLDYYKTKGYLLLAFATLFAAASLARSISLILFYRQYAPRFKQRKRDYFSIISFLKRFDNFGKFAVYHGALSFALMIASPFFNVYMLEELKFSYTTFIIAIVSYSIFYLLFLPIAGRFSDKYGNRRLLMITNIFFILTAILFSLVKTPLGVILLPQLTAGIASAASVISFSNFTYDSVTPRHRSICITYTNMLIGVGTLIGALMGGFIVSYLHPAGINPYIFLFIIAASLRFLVAIIFLPHIKEVRKVKRLPSKYTFFLQPLYFLHSIKLFHPPAKKKIRKV